MLPHRLIVAVMAVLIATTAYARSDQDRSSLEQLPAQFSAAWANHDGHQLAQLMADDVMRASRGQ